MKPTTAADRMLVSSNITSSLDWMLTRDITGRRNALRLFTGSVLTPESGSTDVASPLRPVLKGGMGVLSAVNAAARRLACETCMHRHSEGIEMSGSPDPYDLQRFIDAQEPIFDAVLGELRRGRKRSHWIWFVFPQLQGLGRSPTALRYGISSLQEARAYLAHPVLGQRLRDCARLVAAIDGSSADEIFGWPDNLKVRSSMTLFERATDDNADFRAVLDKFYDGEDDPATVERLSTAR
jgi:uncharacterized protein (DUF1810 family)